MPGIKLLIIAMVVLQVGQVNAESTAFEAAVPGRPFAFPRDHGKHPEFQTEWWYFTGNLTAEDGCHWGFQLTFFRRTMFHETRHRASSWGVRDLYAAHFALTDGKGRRFFHTGLASREGPGLAGAAVDDLHVYIRGWSCERKEDAILLRAAHGGQALDLRLVPVKPLVQHGNSGYSRKGDDPGQASYYYSFSRMTADGTIMSGGVPLHVQGIAWMDHEFGSSILRQDQAGWDWFSLQLDDGSELMVFRLRRNDGTAERPFGTLILREGTAVDLAGRDIMITPRKTWTSSHSGAVYPTTWTVEVPQYHLKLEVSPSVDDQELRPTRGVPVAYWEGAVAVEGSSEGRPVQGRGYVELTGYAHALGGRL
jgi:predicted secreted hydrolase